MLYMYDDTLCVSCVSLLVYHCKVETVLSFSLSINLCLSVL